MANAALDPWLIVGAWIFAALTLGAGVSIIASARRSPQSALAAFAAAQACVAGVAAASGASAATFALAALGVGFSVLVFATTAAAPHPSRSFGDGHDGLKTGPLAMLVPACLVVFGLVASAQVAPFQPDRAQALAVDAPALHLAIAAVFAAMAFASPISAPSSQPPLQSEAAPVAAVAALTPLVAGLAVGVVWLNGGGVTAAIGAGGAVGLVIVLFALTHGLDAARKAAPAIALKALIALGVAGLVADAVLRALLSQALRQEVLAGCLAITAAAATILSFFALAEAARGRA